MNLTTTYLGIRLPHPLMVGSGPLTDDLDTVRELEDAGAAALVLRSLYEEEITGEQMAAFFDSESHGESFAEATSYSPEPESALGPEEYLEHLRRVKAAVAIPVVASLNGTTPGGWISYARLLEQAGADALELDLYHAASDPSTSGAEVERQMIEIVREVKRGFASPSPSSSRPSSPPSPTSPGSSTRRERTGSCSSPASTRSTSTWSSSRSCARCRSPTPRTSLCGCGESRLSRGASRRRSPSRGGVHTALDVVKATMAGAHATQMVSALLRNGPRHLRRRPNGPRSLDGGERVELPRGDARQHELRPDTRSRRLRARELPDDAAWMTTLSFSTRARRA